MGTYLEPDLATYATFPSTERYADEMNDRIDQDLLDADAGMYDEVFAFSAIEHYKLALESILRWTDRYDVSDADVRDSIHSVARVALGL